MVSVRFAGLALLLATALPLLAELNHDEVERIQQEFEKRQHATRTYRSNFKQTLRIEGVRDPVISTGKFFYVAPDSMLIDFDKPKGEYVMIRDDELAYKKTGKPAVRHQIDADEWRHGPTMLLELFRNGGQRFHEHYDVQMKSSGSRLLVTLARKDQHEELPRWIENKLIGDGLTVQSILIRTGENAILYEFSNPVRNGTIDPAIFDRKS